MYKSIVRVFDLLQKPSENKNMRSLLLKVYGKDTAHYHTLVNDQ